MEKITTSILPSTWAISFFIACYVTYIEYTKTELGFALNQKNYFFDTNRRKKYIVCSFIFLLMPNNCIDFLGIYPHFKFSHIKSTLEALSYLAFPISSSTLAISSRFSLPMIKTSEIQESKPFLLVQENIPQIQTLEEKEEYFEQTPINTITDNPINDSIQPSIERIIEAKDCSTENIRIFYEKYSYMIDCSFEIFTDFVNGNVNLTEPIKLKSKSRGDRNTTKTAIIRLIYDIFPFEDLKTKTRKEHLFLINQKYKCFENIYDKKEISLKELINFENKRKKESEKVKNRK